MKKKGTLLVGILFLVLSTSILDMMLRPTLEKWLWEPFIFSLIYSYYPAI